MTRGPVPPCTRSIDYLSARAKRRYRRFMITVAGSLPAGNSVWSEFEPILDELCRNLFRIDPVFSLHYQVSYLFQPLSSYLEFFP